MIRTLFFVILLGLTVAARALYSQTPIAGFTVNPSACLEQGIVLQNQSSNASSFTWDFCFQDLNVVKDVQPSVTVAGGVTPTGISVFKENMNWFGFVSSRDNNKLIRLDFGNSLENMPSVVDLGNVGGLLSGPQTLVFIRENNIVYGILSNFGGGNLLRLSFSAGLGTMPVIESLGTFGMTNPRGVSLVKDQNNKITAAVADFSGSQIVLIDFGISILNNPTISNTISLPLGAGSQPIGIQLINDGSNWFGFASSFSGNTIKRIELGATLSTSFILTDIYPVGSPTELSFQQEGSAGHLFVATAGGNVHRITNPTLAINQIAGANLGNFGILNNTFGFTTVRSSPIWYGFAVDYASNKVSRIKFQADCSSNVTINDTGLATPQNISYKSAGSYAIELTAYSATSESTKQQNITVQNLEAPVVSITNDNMCVSSQITFQAVADPGVVPTSWAWDFGDGHSSGVPSPSNQYASTGTYQVTLDVTASNTCSNRVVKSVQIFNPPAANFTLPAGTVCTGQAQLFTNSSSFDLSSNPLWTWFVDGTQVSTSTDLSNLFAATGSHDVKLRATIPGCSDEKTQTINLQSGPTVDFTYTNNCFGQSIQFTNVTTGSGITTFSWDFGDGVTETSQSNTQHLFAQGDFSVKLTVNNTIGCSNQKTLPISVRNQALADFSYTNGIENLQTNFLGQDLTLSDDQVNEWKWTINNAQPVFGISVNSILPSPGGYPASLSVKTNQGCSYTVSKTITIAASTAPSIITNFSSLACLNENINSQNTSVNSSVFQWDFCFEDLKNISNVGTLGTVSAALVPEGIKTIYDHGNYYTFLTSRDNNKLFRMKLGSDISLASGSDVVELSVTGLSNPMDIRLIKENNIWYALIINFGNGHLLRYRFGNGVDNLPDQTTDLGTFGVLEIGIRGFDLAYDGSNWLAAIVNFNNDKIYNLNLGSGIASISTASSITFTSATVKTPIGVSLIKDSNGWKSLVTSFGTNQIVKIDYSAGFLTIPAGSKISNVYPVSSPFEIAVVEEGTNFYGYVITSTGELHYLNFGTSLSGSLVESANRGNLNGNLANGTAIDIVRTSPNWKGLVVDYLNKKITKLFFSSDCSYVSQQSSTAIDPVGFYFSAAGSYPVELTAYHQNGNAASQQSIMNVSSQTAPTLSFNIDNSRCINVTNTFTSQASENLIHTNWNFGDGAIDDGTNTATTHTFSGVGQKIIKLEAKGVSGCSNYSTQTISIFNPPTANFTLPTPTTFCSNQQYTYVNSSASDVGSNPTWQWSVNGSNVSTAKDLAYAFTSTATQTVLLTASIPGCSTQSSQSINSLVAGPAVSFTAPTTGCLGTPLVFNNTTTDPVVSSTWDFGDGATLSPASIVSHNYATIRSSLNPYIATLSTTNAAGCTNSFSQAISIYSVPQPDFTIEAVPLSCANSLSQFDNNTPVLPDSNISTWLWSFGDSSGDPTNQKNKKNPAYTYQSAGPYSVSLQATSNFGCTNSITKQVNISPSPQAAFTYTPACVNQTSQFSAATSTGNISNYQWSIQNTVSAGVSNSTSYVFKSPGTFPVTLVVTANGCVSQKKIDVIVPQIPTTDFSVTSPCYGHPTVFQELYPLGADPTVSWSWSFGQGQGNGTGSPISYQYPVSANSTQGYSVSLVTTRQSGCVYSASKNITIYPGPKASFSPSVEAGPAPLVVTFNNASTADTFLWQFGDANQTTSQAVSPSFTYSTLGKYKPLLTATNLSTGCSDTLSAEINVVTPRVDAVLKNFSLINNPSSNASKATVTILNSGNIPLVDPEVQIDLSGGALIKEKISGTVRPGKTLFQTLNLEIVPRMLEYVCAEVEATSDLNLTNNKQCVTLSNDDVVLTPYPNPATTGLVNLEWVSAVQENVKIVIYKSNGDIAFEQTVNSVPVGLGQIEINTSAFANGLYLIQFTGNKTSKIYRIMIGN